jgi:hypothetical protein
MQFDIGNLNPGVWFDMTDEVKVCLRVCDGEALRNIRKKTMTKKHEYRKVDGAFQHFIIEETDDDLQSDMIWDYCIVEWEGIMDMKGDPIPCTPENKKLLMGKSIQFAKFVGTGLDKLRKDIEGETVEEEPEKNS